MMDKFFAWMSTTISALYMLSVAYGITSSARSHRTGMALIGIPLLVLWFYLLSVDIRKLITVYQGARS